MRCLRPSQCPSLRPGRRQSRLQLLLGALLELLKVRIVVVFSQLIRFDEDFFLVEVGLGNLKGVRLFLLYLLSDDVLVLSQLGFPLLRASHVIAVSFLFENSLLP